MARNNKVTQRWSKQVTELALAAPQVVMHRTSRMMHTRLSARDRVEFTRMGGEKVVAFYESWAAMWTAAFTVQFELAASCVSTAMSLAAGGTGASGGALASLANTGTKVLSAGLEPVRRKAVANSRRLARSMRSR